MSAMAKWTFMVYMAGDNSLSSAGEVDMGEMARVGSTADVNIVTEFDRAGSDRHTKCYYVQTGSAKEVADLGETDSGDPKVLLDFAAWALASYPAERYALILWNHGGGWEPTEMDRIANKVNARGYSAREAVERSSTPLRRVLFRSTLEAIFALPSAAERAICSDDGSGHSLDTVELGNVLADLKKLLDGKKLDLLGMDACLMSNLEVAYQAEPYVSYIVGSEETEPNEGWPYETVLRKLVDSPNLPTAEFATHIVNAYVESYISRGYTDAVTQAALDLSRLDSVTAPLDALADAVIATLPKSAHKVWTAQKNSARFFYNTLWDIEDFGAKLSKAMRNAKVSKAVKETQTALRPGTGKFVLDQAHHGASVAKVGGVSVYLPSPLVGISQYYSDLAFAKDHRWAKLLQAYHAA